MMIDVICILQRKQIIENISLTASLLHMLYLNTEK
jgi:hypothetical protein